MHGPRPLQHLPELRADRPRRAPAREGRGRRARSRAPGDGADRYTRVRLLLVARAALARAGEAARGARQLPPGGRAPRGDRGHRAPRAGTRGMRRRDDQRRRRPRRGASPPRRGRAAARPRAGGRGPRRRSGGCRRCAQRPRATGSGPSTSAARRSAAGRASCRTSAAHAWLGDRRGPRRRGRRGRRRRGIPRGARACSPTTARCASTPPSCGRTAATCATPGASARRSTSSSGPPRSPRTSRASRRQRASDTAPAVRAPESTPLRRLESRPVVEDVVRPAGPTRSGSRPGTGATRPASFATASHGDDPRAGGLEQARAWQRPDGAVCVQAASEAGVEHGCGSSSRVDDDHSEFLRRFADDPLLGRATRHLRGLRPLRTATVAHALLRAVAGPADHLARGAGDRAARRPRVDPAARRAPRRADRRRPRALLARRAAAASGSAPGAARRSSGSAAAPTSRR